ncbi:HTH-type transcriptional repressor PurR [Streptomyces tendae]
MYVAQCRLRGYREALETAGVVAGASLVVEGGDFAESGQRATTELLARHPDLDAVFAASDTLAAGALNALRAAGRRVPQDVAVIGFDDFHPAHPHGPAADDGPPAAEGDRPHDGATAAGGDGGPRHRLAARHPPYGTGAPGLRLSDAAWRERSRRGLSHLRLRDSFDNSGAHSLVRNRTASTVPINR